MTPILTTEMLAIVRNGVHPFVLRHLGLEGATQFKDRSGSFYHPSLASNLPSASDARGILDFFGLDPATASRVLEATGPSVLSLPGKGRNRYGGRDYPLADALLEAYLHNAPAAESHVPPTYEGYFNCAIQQGLRPEFACTVGLHPEDPRFERAGADFYDVVDPKNAARDRVVANNYLLHELWGNRMEQEGEGSVE